MKNLFTLLLLCVSSQCAFSQVVEAIDWTKTDCAGIEHTLFSELDAGNVVIMELVMLEGCMPCISAAHLMQPIINQFNADYDNRIKWYAMGFNDEYSCDAFADWETENSIVCAAQFEEGADQIDYYGGMGMPTIVVVGRNTHHVYYNQFGFIPADTVDFADAIEYALGLSDPLAINTEFKHAWTIAPNPAYNSFQILHAPQGPFDLRIINPNGSVVFDRIMDTNLVDIQTIPPGLYLAQIRTGEKVSFSAFVIK